MANSTDDVKCKNCRSDRGESKLREGRRRWVAPLDPSTNHDIACSTQYGERLSGSSGRIFEECKSTGSLLEIYGKRMFKFSSLSPHSLLTTIRILSELREENPLASHCLALYPLTNFHYLSAPQSFKAGSASTFLLTLLFRD